MIAMARYGLACFAAGALFAYAVVLIGLWALPLAVPMAMGLGVYQARLLEDEAKP
jgi:uncharacterized membrane protein